MYIDSHAHLDDNRLSGNISEIVAELESGGVEAVVNASCDFKTQADGVALTEKYGRVWALIGCHPHEAKFFDERMIAAMTSLSSHEKVVGVGEIGLDFYYDHSPRETQKRVFEQQLVLADRFGLPVVLHIRDAYGQALEILKERKQYLNSGLLLHCYSGSAETAREFSRLFDCYFAFGGAITFKNASKEEIIKAVPIDRLLTETDAPYLTPEPFRGKTNRPVYVKYVLEKIASVLQKDSGEMQQIVKDNTLRFFKKMKI